MRRHRGIAICLTICALTLAELTAPSVHAQPEGPPPSTTDYLQYGVGLAAESIASARGICPQDSLTPCILGSGLGLAIRAGHRSRGPWYGGGAYEVSRHASSNLLRLAILQQARVETRYYFDRGSRLTGAATAALGAAVYGNEFGAETGGVVLHLGALAEYQLSRTTVVGFAIGYRPLVLRSWTDSAGQYRGSQYGFAIAHVVGLEVTLELRDPLPRW
jgi:hypothetical protein